MTKNRQNKLSKSITKVTQKFPYKEPFISTPPDFDLSKAWYVDYGIWSEREEKIKRKRVVLKGKTKADRLADGKQVISELKATLKAGACVDALKPTIVEPSSDTIQLTTPIRKAIDAYLDYKKKTTKYNSWRTYKSSLGTFRQYLLN